jgi:hypothetical protein
MTLTSTCTVYISLTQEQEKALDEQFGYDPDHYNAISGEYEYVERTEEHEDARRAKLDEVEDRLLKGIRENDGADCEIDWQGRDEY